MSITGEQLRMARAALGLTVRDLAAKADVNPNTITRFEGGADAMAGTLEKLQQILEARGVIFTQSRWDGPGVRLTRTRLFVVDLLKIVHRTRDETERKNAAKVLFKRYISDSKEFHAGEKEAAARVRGDVGRLRDVLGGELNATQEDAMRDLLDDAYALAMEWRR